MRNIKKFNSFVDDQRLDESWRQVKFWLNLPRAIMERLVGLLTGYIPNLELKYDIYAAKVDDNTSLSPGIIKEDPIKLTLDDIQNKRLRNSLKATNILSKWNVYTFNREHENRQPIYITKDELKKGDKFYGGRISDHNIDSEYKSNKRNRLLRKRGVEKFSEIEPQFWVIAAVHTDNHDEMKKERNIRYTKNNDNKLTKLVRRVIKSGNFDTRLDGYPIVFKVVKEDRIDLMKEIIDGSYDEHELHEIINSLLTDGFTIPPGHRKDNRKYYDDKTLMDFVKSDEMRKLIEPYYKDLWQN